MDRITAIGEILFDVYPETKNLGGAPLNFLYHIYKLTGKGNIISRVGYDVLGNKAIEFLEKSGISTNYIQIDHKHPTGVTNVTLDENKIPSFNIDEDRAYDYIETNNKIEKLINENTDCLYFGSLAQRNNISSNTIQNQFGKEIKYFCDINIRQDFYSKEIILKSLQAADVLKLNVDELKLINDMTLNKHFLMGEVISALMEQFSIELIAITKGSEGSTLYFNGEINDYKHQAADAVDTLGAGDAFAAIICTGYVKNWNLEKMNKLANDFASEICQIKGALPTTDDIYNRIRREFDND